MLKCTYIYIFFYCVWWKRPLCHLNFPVSQSFRESTRPVFPDRARPFLPRERRGGEWAPSLWVSGSRGRGAGGLCAAAVQPWPNPCYELSGPWPRRSAVRSCTVSSDSGKPGADCVCLCIALCLRADRVSCTVKSRGLVWGRPFVLFRGEK